MADLSSILGGMVQGFKDFGTGLVDLFGTGGAAIGDAISSIQTGRATTKNQDDFRKWLYNTDSTKDAAAKGLGTALNGVSTVADVIPGAQAVTANPLFNGIQGAIGGVADELKMNGENTDWGRAAQRAGVGAASGLASGYAGQALGKSGNKLLSNGLTRGAVWRTWWRHRERRIYRHRRRQRAGYDKRRPIRRSDWRTRRRYYWTS
jgi:hypothetical protein